LRAQRKSRCANGHKAQSHPTLQRHEIPAERADHEMEKMTSANNTSARNRMRPNVPSNMRSAQSARQSDQNQYGQWQRNYQHYCNLAQQSNSDDAVTREQHWQYAEHFLRLMNGNANLPD
jgi:hypothetical protein